MTTDRIICKQCGNTDSTTLEIIDEGRIVFCRVCKATTPLYSEFKRIDVSGSVIVEGFVSKRDEIRNAEHLLDLEMYEEASKLFWQLSLRYSDSFDVWFGYARAIPRDFSSIEIIDGIMSILNIAAKHTQKGSQNYEKIDSIANCLSSITDLKYKMRIAVKALSNAKARMIELSQRESSLKSNLVGETQREIRNFPSEEVLNNIIVTSTTEIQLCKKSISQLHSSLSTLVK